MNPQRPHEDDGIPQPGPPLRMQSSGYNFTDDRDAVAADARVEECRVAMVSYNGTNGSVLRPEETATIACTRGDDSGNDVVGEGALTVEPQDDHRPQRTEEATSEVTGESLNRPLQLPATVECGEAALESEIASVACLEDEANEIGVLVRGDHQDERLDRDQAASSDENDTFKGPLGDEKVNVKSVLASSVVAAGAVSQRPDNHREQAGAFRMIGDRVVSDKDFEEETMEEQNEDFDGNGAGVRGDFSAVDAKSRDQPILEAHLVDEEAQVQRAPVSGTIPEENLVPLSAQRSSLVIENVVMDGEAQRSLRRISSQQIVQASPMKETDRQPLWKMRKLQLFSLCLIIVTAGVTLGIVYGLSKTDDTAANPTPTPTAAAGDSPARDVGSPHIETTETPTGAPSAVVNIFKSVSPTVEVIGATRESFVNEVLPEFARVALDDPNSDQSRALDWLWSDTLNTSALPLFRRVQRYTVAVYFLASTNLETEDQIAQSGYMNSEHECSWPKEEGVCNVHGEMVVIDTPVKPFVDGTIPPEIGLLTNLQRFDISNTKIGGSIPSTLGLLSQSLQYFIAEKTKLVGSIPTEVGQLSSLVQLTVSETELTATIPTEVGRMTGLQTLSLNENSLTGPIPSEVGQLNQSLLMLWLHNNPISGFIPSELGLLTDLLGLALTRTNVTGTLPSQLSNLWKMEELFAHQTLLNGTIPEEMDSLTQLTSLTLHETQLVGTFPLCNLTTNFGSLNLYTVSCPMVACSCNCTCATGDLNVESNLVGRICGLLGIGWLCG